MEGTKIIKRVDNLEMILKNLLKFSIKASNRKVNTEKLMKKNVGLMLGLMSTTTTMKKKSYAKITPMQA